MIHVCWHEGTDGFTKVNGRSGYSCCTLLNQMFDHYDCTHWSTFQNLPQHVDGAVLVIQGGNEKLRVEEINDDASRLKWVIFMIIGDEGCDFPLEKLVSHPRSKIWFQMPQPGYTVADRNFIVGPSRDVPLYLDRGQTRSLDWFFAGQNTHSRRHQCVKELESMPGGLLIPTRGFMQGIPHKEYFEYMARAKVIPCPSGPASPDTLRMAEALEFGCVPIVDRCNPRYTYGDYWGLVFKDFPPFPIIEHWSSLPVVMEETLASWNILTIRCQRWWVNYKADFNSWLGEDVACLTA